MTQKNHHSLGIALGKKILTILGCVKKKVKFKK